MSKTKSSVKFVTLLFIFLFAFISNAFAYRCFWYVVTPGGNIGEENTGCTAGQATIGEVSGTETYGDGTYGFWYQGFEPVICFNIDHDTWELDSLDVSWTERMVLGEQIVISNCGNCHINFSLRWSESHPLEWSYGYTNFSDRFVTRARFTTELEAPSVYDHARDYVNDAVTWARDDRFGPAGYDMELDELQYLWLEFITPTGCIDPGDYEVENVLTYVLEAQVNLP